MPSNAPATGYLVILGCRTCVQEHHHDHHDHHGWHHHDWHHHNWHHHDEHRAMEKQWASASVDKPAFVDQATAEYCSDAMQVVMCHQKCGHDGACHKECSLPKDEDLKKKVVEKMECHAKCGDDRECHHECHHGCPFNAVREKCRLNFQERLLFSQGLASVGGFIPSHENILQPGSLSLG